MADVDVIVLAEESQGQEVKSEVETAMQDVVKKGSLNGQVVLDRSFLEVNDTVRIGRCYLTSVEALSQNGYNLFTLN